MNNGPLATLYLGWLRARLRSTIFWALGMAAIVVATAAFYPALKNFFADFQAQGSAGVSSLLGLTNGIDPSSPLGYIWSNLYSNTVPWILMALGIALGAAAITGDEEAGTLEYTLSSTATRSQMLITRFAGLFTILLGVAAFSGLALLVTAPLFNLTGDMTVTIDGKTLTNRGLGLSNVAVGTFAAFAVATAEAGIAFSGRRRDRQPGPRHRCRDGHRRRQLRVLHARKPHWRSQVSDLAVVLAFVPL